MTCRHRRVADARARVATYALVTHCLAACGGGGEPPPDAWWEGTAPTGDPSDGEYVPYIAGEYRRVFRPAGTRYLNDHTLVRGPDGTWHVYGITHESTGEPQNERAFLHATAPSLLGPWTTRDDALVADAAFNERALWAPHVIERATGAWSMYYCAGVIAPETPDRCLRRADSTDLTHWTRADVAHPPGGRDPFVLRDGARWLLYSVGVDADLHGQIVASTSTDLVTWSDATAVIADPVPSLVWGNLESPFVARYGGAFYLFLTRTPYDGHTDYVRTVVFRSHDPTRFEWRPVAELRAHAAEIVVQDGQYFITSAGWTAEVGEANRGLLLAPLRWASQP
jgi:beta-fructofuranosidase